MEFNKFGLKSHNLSFSEFIDIVSNELAKQTLNNSVELAEKYGLSTITMDEITEEVKAQRIKDKEREDSLELLLNGPTFSKKQLETVAKTRKAIDKWRTK